MITIKNSLRKIPFCDAQLFKKAQRILRHLDYADFDLGIKLTTDQTIKKYNKQFRNIDKATDVLSFPYYTELNAGERINAGDPDDKNLGDIIISLEYVKENKKNLPGTFEERVDLMLVHGICHLLGYDHIEDKDFEKMEAKEKELTKVMYQFN